MPSNQYNINYQKNKHFSKIKRKIEESNEVLHLFEAKQNFRNEI